MNNNHACKNSQELFVAENYGHDDPVLAVQTAVNAMFAKTFLAYKTLVVLTSQKSTGENDLTPGKSQRKLYLGELKYLVMKPMICKCVKTNFCSCTTSYRTSKYCYFLFHRDLYCACDYFNVYPDAVEPKYEEIQAFISKRLTKSKTKEKLVKGIQDAIAIRRNRTRDNVQKAQKVGRVLADYPRTGIPKRLVQRSNSAGTGV
jgi:hypothetical protein